MEWLDKLFGLGTVSGAESTQARSELMEVEKVLTSVDPDKAPYVACLALLTARLAGADLEISPGEKLRMAEVLQQQTQITSAEATAAAEIASAQELAKNIEHSRITTLMNKIATMDQKKEIIRALFYVACDEDISEVESEKIRSISSALLMTNDQYINLRAEYSEHRSILKK